jgi:hypothetical protein
LKELHNRAGAPETVTPGRTLSVTAIRPASWHSARTSNTSVMVAPPARNPEKTRETERQRTFGFSLLIPTVNW